MREPRIPKTPLRQSSLRTNWRRQADHLDFIRSLPCLCCGAAPSQAAHVRLSKDGGIGFKPADRYTVPLCWKCHRRQHDIGEVRFWGEHGIDPVDFSVQLWHMSGDYKAGMRTIDRAHQVIALKARRLSG